MEKKAETPTAARVRELLDRARNHAYDARIRRTTDESVLRAIDALAEAVALLATDQVVQSKPQRDVGPSAVPIGAARTSR